MCLLITLCFIFRLMTQWRFNRGIEEQTKAFLDGFNEVVPLYWLQYFDEKEIEVFRPPRAQVQNRTFLKRNVVHSPGKNSKYYGC